MKSSCFFLGLSTRANRFRYWDDSDELSLLVVSRPQHDATDLVVRAAVRAPSAGEWSDHQEIGWGICGRH